MLKIRVQIKGLQRLLLIGSLVLNAHFHVWAQSVETLRTMSQQSLTPLMSLPTGLGTNLNVNMDTNLEKQLSGLEQAMIEQLTNDRQWRWLVGLDMGWYYDSNVFLTTKAVSDQVFRPGLNGVLVYGDPSKAMDFTAQYGVQDNIFQQKTVPDSVSQNGQFSAGWRPCDRLNFQNALTYSQTRGNGLQVGSQVRIDNLVYAFNTRYQAGEKLSLGPDCNFSWQKYENTGTYTDESCYLSTDYQLTSKLRLGVEGGGGGRSATNDTLTTSTNAKTSETYAGARLRFNYYPTEKISINALTGMENRFFSLGGSRLTPRIELGSQYQIFERTRLQFSAYEHVESSLASNYVDIQETKGVTASVTQRLFNKIDASLSIGAEREKLDYAATGIVTKGATIGTEGLRYLQGAITWNFLTYSSFSIYSKRISRQTSSVATGQPYDQTVIGTELMVSY